MRSHESHAALKEQDLQRTDKVFVEVSMKRYFIAGFSILSVASLVSWKLAGQQETSVSLQDIRVIPNSEHANSDPAELLARLRIRFTPMDVTLGITASAEAVPQIALASE